MDYHDGYKTGGCWHSQLLCCTKVEMCSDQSLYLCIYSKANQPSTSKGQAVESFDVAVIGIFKSYLETLVIA
jgi:hypothetical protein